MRPCGARDVADTARHHAGPERDGLFPTLCPESGLVNPETRTNSGCGENPVEFLLLSRYIPDVLIHSIANYPLRSELLADALADVANFARQHLTATEHSEISIALDERGARIHQALAPLLPANAKEFYIGMPRVGTPLTAAQFLHSVSENKPERTHSLITLKAAALRDPLALYDELSRVVPASGRGLTVLLILKGWRFRGNTLAADVDLTLSRLRQGASALSAGLNIRFHALSLKDPVVQATLVAAGERAGVPFGKPMAAFAAAANMPFGAPTTEIADERLLPPSSRSQLIVLQTYDEALARASDQISAMPEGLESVPMLFSRSEGFDKRMKDVTAGKKESIGLPARLKRFVREQFPSYAFEAATAEQLWFRRPVAPTLDLLLIFDKVHQWGLGKTFTVEFAVDFPNTPFGGMHTGFGGTRRNIFWLFHQGWETQVWAYTTKAELETVLDSCAGVLKRVLPALEQHCRELLLPIPAELPKRIEQRGPLSAREAYRIVLPLARTWAADAELESLATVNLMNADYPIGSIESSIDDSGRLRSPGTWGFKFLSRKLDRYCYYTVPHTGRLWWSFYSVPQGGIPKYSSVLAIDDSWLDSTEIAPRAFAGVRERLNGLRADQIWLAIRDPQRYSGNFVWEANAIAYRGPAERREITVQLDRKTGDILDVQQR